MNIKLEMDQELMQVDQHLLYPTHQSPEERLLQLMLHQALVKSLILS